MGLLAHSSRLPDTTLLNALLAVAILIGLVTILQLASNAISGLYVYFLRAGKPLKKLGKWSVISGATDGIGRAYADALAKKVVGMKVRAEVMLLLACRAVIRLGIATVYLASASSVSGSWQARCYRYALALLVELQRESAAACVLCGTLDGP